MRTISDRSPRFAGLESRPSLIPERGAIVVAQGDPETQRQRRGLGGDCRGRAAGKVRYTMAPPPDHLVTLPDAALMELITGMDADAFEAFYDRHVSSAYALAYRIVGSRQPADDVCQEAFLAIWRSASRYDPKLGNARSWVLAVVRNRSIDYLRRATRTKQREVQDEALAERHPAPAADNTETAALRSAAAGETRLLLDELSDDQRRVIELSFYSGYSHSEIAEMLALPLGTVKARMNRGLAKMRGVLSAGGAS